MAVGCPFITCAVKKKGVEFCWLCDEQDTCEKWKAHREYGKCFDTFKCYQKLEHDIHKIKTDGVDEFVDEQRTREKILIKILSKYNEGRSKTYYSIACTVMEIAELESVIAEAMKTANNLNLKERSFLLHQLLDKVAKQRNYILKLRKKAT